MIGHRNRQWMSVVNVARHDDGHATFAQRALARHSNTFVSIA